MNDTTNQHRLTALSTVNQPGGNPPRRVRCVDADDNHHDAVLLQRYKQSGCDDAFQQLVHRHADWVNALVRRKIKDRHLAEDVTQAVFIILARKARSIRSDMLLSAWLFRVARFAARDAVKQEARRTKRWDRTVQMRAAEIEDIDGISRRNSAVCSNGSPAVPDADLDDAIACLSESDRRVILLRFYEDKTMAEVGITLGISEVAAKQRVSRALKRLRSLLKRRGVKIASLGLLVTLLRGTHTTEAAMTSDSLSLAALGRAEASGQSLHTTQSTLRAMTGAQCRLWAAMSSGVIAVVVVIGILSPVMGQAALAPLLRSAQSAILRGLTDLPRAAGMIFAPVPTQSVPLAKVWVGKTNERAWPVLPPDAPRSPLVLQSISKSNVPVAVAEDAQGNYWYRQLRPHEPAHLIDLDLDGELLAMVNNSQAAQRNFLESSLAYFHAAAIAPDVQAGDWLPLDPPGSDGVVVLPFGDQQLNANESNIDGANIDLQTVVVPEPSGFLLLSLSALLLRRQNRRAV